MTRLPVDRTFSMRGFGTVVTGTLSSGTVHADQALVVLPGDGRTTVRGLHVHGQPRQAAAAGERVAMNLTGVDVDAVPRGAVLAAPGALMPTRRVDAELTLLPGTAPLKHGARVRVHQGTAEVLARVSVAGAAGTVAAGATALVRLRLERPAVLARRDRFIVRTYSPLVTIGGGVVLDPDPPRTGLRAARAVARLDALRVRPDLAADVTAAATRMVADAGLAGTSVPRLAARLGRPGGEVRAALAALETAGSIVAAGEWAVDRAAATAATAAMLAGIDAFHRAQPLADGLPLEEARTRWFAHAPSAVFERLVAELAAAGRVVARDTIAAAGHRLVLSDEETDVANRLDVRLREAGVQPPDMATLAAEWRRSPAVVDRVVQLLVKQRRLVRLDTLIFHPAALERLKAEIVARKAAAPDGRATVDVKSFKDAYGVTRKYAIPLLEYLDRERVTRRAGDVRIVL